MIPTPAECLRLMDEYRMLPNIRAHSLMVASISELLALARRQRGEEIDVELAVAAALLHDIGKSLCLDNDQDHAALGRDICLHHDFEELAPLVAQHVVLAAASFPATPLSAKELVYYADKRVNHDQIVSLGDRLRYIIDRYGHNDPRRVVAIQQNFEHCLLIERAIFNGLDFGPAEVPARLAVSPPTWGALGAVRGSECPVVGLCQ